MPALSREPRRKHECPERDFLLRSSHRGVPLFGGLGSENAQRAAGDEMALQVKGVVDSGMGGEKVLRGTDGLEALRLSLPSSNRLI